jgi:N-acetyl-anhydromuramyl-L-alanine amidase AmpD
MHYRRRSLLKAGGASIVSARLLGETATDTEAAPPVRWEPAARSNYWEGNRTTADIDWIILHTIEGSYQVGINTFKNPSENVSAHYVVGSEPGQFTKMVRTRDIAWTAGNAEYNRRGINIEMSGFSDTGFSDQMYENMAELVEFLCESYDIPKRVPDYRVAPCDPDAGNGGIIGHIHVPDPNDCSSRGGAGGHTDPGPYFDYDRLLDAITGDPKPAFEIGDTVAAGRDLNVRAEPEIDFNVVHTFPAGATGTIIDGYRIAENYLWWQIDWEGDITGWAVQSYLEPGEEDTGDGGGGNDSPRDGGDDDRGDDSDDDRSEDGEDGRERDRRFEIGDTVTSTVELNTREEPGLSAVVRETVAQDAVGRITDGIVTADDYVWWQIEWETGTTGWSVQTYLEPSEKQLPPDDPDAAFDVGQRVSTTVDLNTREKPSLGGDVVDTVSPDTAGRIAKGLVSTEEYTWWQIEWVTGTMGWSVQTYLEPSETDLGDDETDESEDGKRAPGDEEPGDSEDSESDSDGNDDDSEEDSDSGSDDAENDAGRFDVGETVAATTELNTRTEASLDGSVEETVPAGTAGWIQDTAVTADGNTWWQVRWETGTTGWSVQNHLERGGGTDGIDRSATKFEIGQRVTTMVELNTREKPSLDGAVEETVSPETVGWIQDGIVTADGYTWWQVEWETGTTGWSVQTYLDESKHWEWVSGLFGE